MGAFSILNDISALRSQNLLTQNSHNLSNTLLRLSSGKRINSGADDAAGLQIADSLRANIRALDQAARNASDGIGVAQIADGALDQITTILTRSVTLAEESANGTIDSTGRASLQAEFVQIQAEVARISVQTNFNGVAIFTTGGINGALSIFVGDTSAASSISVKINTITTSGDTVTGLGGTNLAGVDLSTQTGAVSALTTLRDALRSVSSNRATIGAGMNRLQAAVAVITNVSQNSQSAESTLRDANVAEEVANLTKFQILAQSGLAALAQANTSHQLVLNLFQGR
jgi:flagellin